MIHIYASELNMSGSGTVELPDGTRGRVSYKLHSGEYGEYYDESDVQISGTKSLFNKISDDDVLRIHATPTIYCDCKYSGQLKYDPLLFHLGKRVRAKSPIVELKVDFHPSNSYTLKARELGSATYVDLKAELVRNKSAGEFYRAVAREIAHRAAMGQRIVYVDLDSGGK